MRVALILSSSAYADCTSPAAPAGVMQYASPHFMLCDGAAWSRLAAAAPSATACATAGVLQQNGSVMQFCNGANWVTVDGTQTNGTCAAGSAGLVQYDSSKGWMQWCNGTNWKVMQNATPAITFVQNAGFTSNSSAGNTIVTSALTAVQSGDLIVCRFNYEDTTMSGVSDSAGNTYVPVGPAITDSDTATTSAYYRLNAAAGSSVTVTGTLASAYTGFKEASCQQYRGAVTVAGLDQAASATDSTATATIGNLVTTSAKELIWLATFTATVCTAPAGFTQRSAVNGNRHFDRLVNAIGSYATATTGCGTPWTMIGATFRSQ